MTNIRNKKQIYGEGVFANVLYDETFKVVASDPRNERMIIDILELLLPGKKISRLVQVNHEQHGFAIWEKNCTFDLLCTDADTGEEFLVEMQFSPMDSFRERMLYYSTFPFRLQMAERENEPEHDPMDYSLKPLYVISIVNFSLEHESEEALEQGLISRYNLANDRNGELMTDALHFVYLELGRLKAGFGEHGKCRTLLEKLSWNMKYGFMLKERPADFEDEISRRFYKATEMAAFDQVQQKEYEEAMSIKIDQAAREAYARKEGEKIGIEKGIEEGREKGREETKAFIAKVMLDKGYSVDVISELTGISKEEIEKLQ